MRLDFITITSARSSTGTSCIFEANTLLTFWTAYMLSKEKTRKLINNERVIIYLLLGCTYIPLERRRAFSLLCTRNPLKNLYTKQKKSLKSVLRSARCRWPVSWEWEQHLFPCRAVIHQNKMSASLYNQLVILKLTKLTLHRTTHKLGSFTSASCNTAGMAVSVAIRSGRRRRWRSLSRAAISWASKASSSSRSSSNRARRTARADKRSSSGSSRAIKAKRK